MSIQKKPEEALPLQGATTDDANEVQSLSSKIDDFKWELENMRDVSPYIKKWEKRIVNQFFALEKELVTDSFKEPKMKSEVENELDHMTTGIRDLGKSIPKVDRGISRLRVISSAKPGAQPADDEFDDHPKVFPKWVDLGVENKILESDAMLEYFASFHCLSGSQEAKMCSLCLSVFPRNSIIEKKPLIYWWIGEGLVSKRGDETAEEVGEEVFQGLLDEGFIRASSKNKSLSVNSFIIDPWIHWMLILIAKKYSFVKFSPQWAPCNGKRRAFLCQENEEETEDDVMMVFNVDEQYLGMKPEWLSKLRKVEVLQMGRWHNSVTHHIEVEDKTLFNALGCQKLLKYLSLRGISRIETLPDSISKLNRLQILDLRACHNLEKLPPTISKLKNLTHLDVSHCYLLESMPKGLELLAALQVVKGFVIGKAYKNSCKIDDLAKLENLRKLSIRVGEKMHDDQLRSLGTFPALHILTISWGNVSSTQGRYIPLPSKLTKLDLRCVPFESVPDWLSPSKLPSNLSKLYIKGGRLKSLKIRDGEVWKVRFLRFKYLDSLKLNEEPALANYKYLNKFDCYEIRPDITSTSAADTPETIDPLAAQNEIEEQAN